jgi:hypothetical protein
MGAMLRSLSTAVEAAVTPASRIARATRALAKRPRRHVSSRNDALSSGGAARIAGHACTGCPFIGEPPCSPTVADYALSG